jgi:hypothetical protein
VQPETNEIIPTPEVQAQAADLIETAQAEDVLILPAPPELEFQPTSSPLKDGKKPDYYRTLPDGTIEALTKAEYKAGMRKEYTVRHRPLPCGHKLVAGHAPRHRNCDACWFTFFQVHGDLTKAVDEAYNSQGTEVGRELIKQLRGTKFLRNFLKFMSTIALMKARMEGNVQEATI